MAGWYGLLKEGLISCLKWMTIVQGRYKSYFSLQCLYPACRRKKKYFAVTTIYFAMSFLLL